MMYCCYYMIAGTVTAENAGIVGTAATTDGTVTASIVFTGTAGTVTAGTSTAGIVTAGIVTAGTVTNA
eukprot:1293727-Heterocapsa_arctica.AAC.1